MKVGLTASAVLHATLLGFGLFSLSTPRAFEVGAVESFPVDIVPIEEISQIQQGERDAPLAERAAPTPTSRPQTVPDAQNVGDQERDMAAPETPEQRNREVEVAATPPPQPDPAPRPTPEPEPQPQAAEPPPPAPQPEPEPVEQAAPAPEPEPEPEPAPQVAEAPRPDAVALPDRAPAPQARPQPQQPRQTQTAEAPRERQPERQPDRPAERPAAQQERSEDREFDADQVAALLNRDRASGGGAQRSTEQAALGGRQTTGGSRLSQSEMDALRGQIQRCWNIPAGAVDAENLKVSVQFRLDQSGGLANTPEIVAGGGGGGVQRAAAESARRAILQCAPYNLPSDKYDAWAEVIVHFDPRDMF